MALGYGIYGNAVGDPEQESPDALDLLAGGRDLTGGAAQGWLPESALPMESRESVAARVARAALSSAPAPSPRFSILGAPMGRLAQPDYVPETPQAVPGTEDTFLNRLGPELARLQTARLGPQASNMERFLASMLTSGARSWGSRRAQQVEDANAKQDAMVRRAAAQNERNAKASAEARAARIEALKESSAAEKKARAEREGWVTVPGYIATAMGDAKLTGTSVPPAKYNSMLATWRAKQKPAGGSDTGPDRTQLRTLGNQFRNADMRIGSMRRRIAAMEAGGKPPESDSNPAWTRYQKLQDDLAEQEDRAAAAYAGLSEIGAPPTGQHWKPAQTTAAPNPGVATAAPVAAPSAKPAAPAKPAPARSTGNTTADELIRRMRAGGIASRDSAQAYIARYRGAMKANGIKDEDVLRAFR